VSAAELAGLTLDAATEVDYVAQRDQGKPAEAATDGWYALLTNLHPDEAATCGKRG
jgi:hypothetical protein